MHTDRYAFTAPSARRPHRAIVIGASLAGLLCARVLSDRFHEVVLLERDALPEGSCLRKGTPHTGHAHGLLARGRMVMEQLFPGLTATLRAHGAQSGDLGANTQFFYGPRRFANAPAGLSGIAVSRPLLEAELRRRVRARPGVRLLTEVDALEPVYDPLRESVAGVRVMHRADGARETLTAGLVVDCSGRASRSPAWLQDWGYDAPQEERVQIGMGYVTAYFRRLPHHAPGVTASICGASPELPRPGVMISQEPAEPGGPPRWVVTVGGYMDDRIDCTFEALRERALRMASPELAHVVQHAELLGPPTAFRFPHSQRRRYERLERFPRNYLVAGDALASFNPTFGQGMSVAACEAIALRAALAYEGLGAGLAARFFEEAATAIDVPWQTAVRADLAIVGAPGVPSAPARLVGAYMQRLFRAAEHDAQVANAFRKVAHLIATPPSLFAPAIVARVLWGSRRARAISPLSAPARRAAQPQG